MTQLERIKDNQRNPSLGLDCSAASSPTYITTNSIFLDSQLGWPTAAVRTKRRAYMIERVFAISPILVHRSA